MDFDFLLVDDVTRSKRSAASETAEHGDERDQKER
jgi:hypothetical protein